MPPQFRTRLDWIHLLFLSFFFFTFYIRFSYIIQRKLNPFFAGEHVLLQYKKKRKLPFFFAGEHVFVLHFERKQSFIPFLHSCMYLFNVLLKTDINRIQFWCN